MILTSGIHIMNFLHYIIVGGVIIYIIAQQRKIFREAKNKIEQFREIIPGNKLDYEVRNALITIEGKETQEYTDPSSDILWQDDEMDNELSTSRDVTVSQIYVKSNNPTMQKITGALNMYLQKNRGAASDFNLMKDVVERYCDAEEEEITVMQPLPLYMGLMGTMVGIIVGILYIAVSGGVENLSNISTMMICVAIAMFASLAGIFCTTRISSSAKDATTQLEANKNNFYSWIQTELLPVLSGNAVTALSLLQSNLMEFNQTFSGNIDKFDKALGDIREVSKNQADALTAINKIDIRQVAEANIRVLRELKQCTSELDRFTQYIQNTSSYLENVRTLNQNLDNHLDRTAAIEKMGSFFEKELSQVETREELIKSSVANVDKALIQSCEDLKTGMDNYFAQIKNKTEEELKAVQDAFMAQQQEELKKIKEEEETAVATIKAQQDELLNKTVNLEKVLQGIQSLSATKSSIDAIVEATKVNTRRLDSVIQAIEAIEIPAGNGAGIVPGKGKNFDKAMKITVVSAVSLGTLVIIIEFIMKLLA